MTLEEAQANLSEVIDQLAPGEMLIITRNARPVAQLVGLPGEKPHPVPGRGRGQLVILAEDDEHFEGRETGTLLFLDGLSPFVPLRGLPLRTNRVLQTEIRGAERDQEQKVRSKKGSVRRKGPGTKNLKSAPDPFEPNQALATKARASRKTTERWTCGGSFA
jgi:prevent-host-death family protein